MRPGLGLPYRPGVIRLALRLNGCQAVPCGREAADERRGGPMRRARAVIAAAAASMIMLVPRASFGTTNGEIAFSSVPHENTWMIGTINPDGTGAKPRAEGTSPAWSPDGRKMAYISPGGPRNETVIIRGGGATVDTG